MSEVPGWKVLLLEAGGKPPPESHIPGFNQLLLRGDADWNYFTETEPNAFKGFAGEVGVLRDKRVKKERKDG